MKFLVLALCVCAASAASFGANFGAYTPYSYSKAGVQAAAKVVSPVVAPAYVSKAVTSTPYVAPVVPYTAPVAPVVYPAAAAVATAAYTPVVAAKAAYTGAAQILRQESEVRPDGFGYAYETENGISGEATGELKNVGETGSVAIRGSYRYTSPDGTPVVVTYVADENGYQPQSDVLPVGPPVPEAIARALAYISAHPPRVENQKY